MAKSDYTVTQIDSSTKKGKESIYWKDAKFPLTGQNFDVSSGRVDYNYYNGAAGFATNARYPEEPISMICQLNHDWDEGSEIRPHIHWKQQGATIPNFLLAYKIIDNGTAGVIETDFSNHTLVQLSSHAFTYTSGVLEQISSFPAIDMTGYALSDMIHFVLFRDTANTSTLFAGADTTGNIELVTEFDVHFQLDRFGSEQEFVKEA